MPQYSVNTTANPSSEAPTTPPPKAAPPSPQFAKSQQSSSPSGPDRPENASGSGEPPRSSESPGSGDGSSPERLPEKELPEEELSLEAFAFEHSCFCDNALFQPEDHIVHKKALTAVHAAARAQVHFGPNKTHQAV